MTDESQNATEKAWAWSSQREKAALAVAECATISEAARVAGVARETIHKWLRHAEFKARVDEHLEEVVSAARFILRRNATAAAQQLVNLHAHGHAMHTVKLAASKDILDRVGLKPVQEVKQENIGELVIRVRYDDPND